MITAIMMMEIWRMAEIEMEIEMDSWRDAETHDGE